jgi:hypothetical protein
MAKTPASAKPKAAAKKSTTPKAKAKPTKKAATPKAKKAVTPKAEVRSGLNNNVNTGCLMVCLQDKTNTLVPL